MLIKPVFQITKSLPQCHKYRWTKIVDIVGHKKITVVVVRNVLFHSFNLEQSIHKVRRLFKLS